MSQILLTNCVTNVDAPREQDALWIYGSGWTPPNDASSVPVKVFMDDPWRHLRGKRRLVLLGLVSSITTPGNRVKTGQFFTDPLEGFERWSIDDKLFVVDPWRLWWHFGCVGEPIANCNTSYRMESQYKQYVEGRGENPCDKKNLLRHGTGRLKSLRPFRFGRVEYHIEPMPAGVRLDYAKEKELAFHEEHTINAILKRLGDFVQRVYPERHIPSHGELFKMRAKLLPLTIKATDLGIDCLLLSWIRERIDLIEFAAVL